MLELMIGGFWSSCMFWRMGDWMHGSETLCLWFHQIRLRSDTGVDDWCFFEFMYVLAHG